MLTPSRRELLLGGLAAAAAAAVAPTGALRAMQSQPVAGRLVSADLKPIIISLDTVVDLLDPQAFRTFGAQTVTASLYSSLLSQEFSTDADGGIAGTGVFTNFVSYSNTELDAVLAEGLFELDADKRAELSAQAQQILHDEAPIVPLYSPDWVVVTRSNVTGIAKGDDEKLRFALIRKD